MILLKSADITNGDETNRYGYIRKPKRFKTFEEMQAWTTNKLREKEAQNNKKLKILRVFHEYNIEEIMKTINLRSKGLRLIIEK